MFVNETNNVFFVRENEKVPYSVAIITGNVSDPSCSVHYAIWNPQQNKYVNTTDLFAINDRTGELSALVSFDFETVDRYELVVAVQSENLFAQLEVEVRVVDVDDHHIQLIDKEVYYEISEAEPIGEFTGTAVF
ncbi:hypothetical protein AB6A40_001539 [Gnathostoma spinigerum]|uniref:Cadherin domain-containing protein n=1 Tax=Gnathostoma spinigerum TaxID=75299 RepID=A0ABD6E5E6_9BILA